MRTRDEARGRLDTGAERPRWALGWRHQFDLVRRQDGVRYLSRWWVVNTPLGGVAVHRMDGPDARDVLHDHPFTFCSLVLRGGYVERRLDPLTMRASPRPVRRWNRMRKFDAHVIVELLRVPTWTLLWIGPKRRTWGFLEPELEVVGSTAGVPVHRQTGRWRWTEHTAFDSGHDLDVEEEA